MVKVAHWSIVTLVVEDVWVGFLELLEHLLTVLQLHQRWLEGLDCVEDFLLQGFIADDEQSLLKHIVAELVVDELLDDEVYSGLEVLGLLGLAAELFHKLLVVIWKVTFEYFVDMGFR